MAWAMLNMNGVAGYAGWRWSAHQVILLKISNGCINLSPRLYIIEGIITVVCAVICVFVIPKDYETAYFLNDDDKALMRIRAEEMEAYSGGSGHYTKKEMKDAAKDIKTWAHSIIQICVVTILYGEKTPVNEAYRSIIMC